MVLDTHNLKVDFGRHRGQLYTRLPISYLRWMINTDHSRKEYAEAELIRRGTPNPELEVSIHAMDRFSEKYIWKWLDLEQPRKGLNSWLIEQAGAALVHGNKDSKDPNRIAYMGITYVFEECDLWPVVKTIL